MGMEGLGCITSDVESGVFILKLLQSATLLLGIAAVIIGFISFSKRKPPIAEELYRDFATLKALNELRDDLRAAVKNAHADCMATTQASAAEVRRQVECLRTEYLSAIDELFGLNRTLSNATEESLRAIARTLGRHDGKLENCPGPKACARGQEGA